MRLFEWADLLRQVVESPHGFEALALIVRYAMDVSEGPSPVALEEFLDHEIGPQARETVVTIAEKLIHQGIQQGKLEGQRLVILRLLRHRFGAAVDEETERRLAGASDEEMARLTERLLSASTLAELFTT